MSPRLRYIIYLDTRTYTWAVHDRLRSYSIRTRLAQVVATNLARDYEAEWRRQCAAWIEAEHWDSTP